MTASATGPVPAGVRTAGPARVLVSACLLGEKVRYDGGQRRDPFLARSLGRFVAYVPVCPERECGLPVPREAMRLAGDRRAPRLVTIRTGIDHTARMARFAAARLRTLAAAGLCGYVCKKGSPSCALKTGLFTKAFRRRFPLVPVEEEGRLGDPVAREMFLETVFTTKRFRDAVGRGRSRRALAAFHAAHDLLLLAHGRAVHAAMGRLVARAKDLPAETLVARYRELLAKALALVPTRAKRSVMLVRAMGRLGGRLSPARARDLRETIAGYRRGAVPLAAPMALIRRCARECGNSSVAGQAVFDPYPARLMRPGAGSEVQP